MIPRNHRPGLQVHRTQTRRRLLAQAVRWGAGALAITSLLGTYAAAELLNQPEPADQSYVDELLVQGIQHSEQAARWAEAYGRGQRDALRAVQHTPDGLELAQACLALRAAQGEQQ